MTAGRSRVVQALVQERQAVLHELLLSTMVMDHLPHQECLLCRTLCQVPQEQWCRTLDSRLVVPCLQWDHRLGATQWRHMMGLHLPCGATQASTLWVHPRRAHISMDRRIRMQGVVVADLAAGEGVGGMADATEDAVMIGEADNLSIHTIPKKCQSRRTSEQNRIAHRPKQPPCLETFQTSTRR